jgi:hypothetical protein
MQRFMPLLPKAKAIVSILGTGSNCDYFDGKRIASEEYSR